MSSIMSHEKSVKIYTTIDCLYRTPLKFDLLSDKYFVLKLSVFLLLTPIKNEIKIKLL